MLKMMCLVDGNAVDAFDFNVAAESAAAEGYEFYEETFGSADENLDHVDVTVQYDQTGETFDVRVYVCQNPLALQYPTDALMPLFVDIAKRRVAHYLAEQEEKNKSFMPGFKRGGKKKREDKKRENGFAEDGDFIPF